MHDVILPWLVGTKQILFFLPKNFINNSINLIELQLEGYDGIGIGSINQPNVLRISIYSEMNFCTALVLIHFPCIERINVSGLPSA